MAIAKPDYLPDLGIRDSSPGHRFSAFFDSWNSDWSLKKDGKTGAIKACCALPEASKLQAAALVARQKQLIADLPETERLTFERLSAAPFATGLGNEHPVENGFSFLTPYGLPYLAGSGFKGVLRRAAEELVLTNEAGWTWVDIWWLFGFEGASGGLWERGIASKDQQPSAYYSAYRQQIPVFAERPDLADFIDRVLPKKEAVRFKADRSAFLAQLQDNQTLRQSISFRGALDCWDVFPKPAADQMVVEVMTAHHTNYLQKGATPNDSEQPNPIPFLAVPAKSQFNFHIRCQRAHLPEAVANRWQQLVTEAFDHACDWLGFGAKTAVGYGAMETDSLKQLIKEAREGKPTVVVQGVQWQGITVNYSPGNGEVSVNHDGKKAIAKAQGDAERLALCSGDEALAKRLKEKKVLKGVTVVIEAKGNQWAIVGITSS